MFERSELCCNSLPGWWVRTKCELSPLLQALVERQKLPDRLNDGGNTKLRTMVMQNSLGKAFVEYATKALSISTPTRGNTRSITHLKNDPVAVYTPRTTLPTLHLKTSKCRSKCAHSGVDTSKHNPVRTSSLVPQLSVSSHHEIGTKNGPCSSQVCQGPGLQLVTTARSSSTSGARHRVTDFWQELTLNGRLTSGRGARNRATWTIFVDLCETLYMAGFSTNLPADNHFMCDPSKP